jgi:hypothetical protein
VPFSLCCFLCALRKLVGDIDSWLLEIAPKWFLKSEIAHVDDPVTEPDTTEPNDNLQHSELLHFMLSVVLLAIIMKNIII